MKLLLFTDVHWCCNSSIIQAKGERFSQRLENLIASMNWVNNTAIENNCDAMICLGDFFDRPHLNDEELTALKEVNWNNLPCYFLCGNHESSVKDLRYSSLKALESDNHMILDKPTALHNMLFLPYIKESELKSLEEYWNDVSLDKNIKRIVFSHNSIKGIQMGPVISKEGIEIEEIDSFCDIFLNGHLHNGLKFSKKGINLGNLTGQNFGEDALRYSHNAFIFDTETLQLTTIENPYAFNFYKFEINSDNDLNKLANIKNNSVISIKCKDSYFEKVKELLNNSKVLQSRILLSHDVQTIVDSEGVAQLLNTESISHLQKFIEFAKESLDNNEILFYELSKICENNE